MRRKHKPKSAAIYGVSRVNNKKNRSQSMNSELRQIILEDSQVIAAIEEYLHRLKLVNQDERIKSLFQEFSKDLNKRVWYFILTNEKEEVTLTDQKTP